MLRSTKWFATVSAVLYSVPVSAWLVFRYWKGESWPAVAMLNAVGLWWFAPLVLLLPLALLVRARQASVMMSGVLLIALLLFGRDLLPASARRVPDDIPRLRVLSFNVLVSNQSDDAVLEMIAAQAPDVIALQELSPEMSASLEARLGEQYPYRLLYPWTDPRGTGLLSRFPLQEGPTLSLDLWERWGQSAVIDVGGQAVLLVNVHLWPIGTLDRVQFAQALGRQHQQVAALKELLATYSGMPVLMVGDFNASPTNESYARLADGLEDSWRSVGSGLGFTWPARGVLHEWMRPLLRIDYQWSGGAVTPLSLQVLPTVTGSDHLPLLGEYAIGEGATQR